MARHREESRIGLSKWQPDRGVPVGIILALLVQSAGLLWVFSTVGASVQSVGAEIRAISADIDGSIERMITNIDEINKTLARVEAAITRLTAQDARRPYRHTK